MIKKLYNENIIDSIGPPEHQTNRSDSIPESSEAISGRKPDHLRTDHL